MKNILIIHGPNMNLLGEREPEIYGTKKLGEINAVIKNFAEKKSLSLKFLQSNHEGEIIDFIHKNRKWADGIIINPAAYTHYSYAIRDAIKAVRLPSVEVHLSDVTKREDFRRVSVVAPVCKAVVSGKGSESYTEGIEILLKKI